MLRAKKAEMADCGHAGVGRRDGQNFRLGFPLFSRPPSKGEFGFCRKGLSLRPCSFSEVLSGLRPKETNFGNEGALVNLYFPVARIVLEARGYESAAAR